MIRSAWFRRAAAALILAATALAAMGQARPPEKFTNLKVLPKDVSPAELRATMSGFTRALGVRCAYCHVIEEGPGPRHEDFARDDKPPKRTARVMMQMTRDLNDKYLASLAHRSDPAVHVQCATCHRGAPQPRMLQDVLAAAYVEGGLDTTLARYHALRDRYYGRFTYDFGEVPLVDVATLVRADGHPDDAVRLLAFNVEMNPGSAFAKRQHAAAAMALAFNSGSADSGRAAYRRLTAEYGPAVVNENLLDDLGHALIGGGHAAAAVAVFELNASEHPRSAGAQDGLGAGYAATGDRDRAIAAYTRAAALDSADAEARAQLESLRRGPK